LKIKHSTLKAVRKKDKVELTIERNTFDFLPDKGMNFNMLKKVEANIYKLRVCNAEKG
jgi:hypothetical protein